MKHAVRPLALIGLLVAPMVTNAALISQSVEVDLSTAEVDGVGGSQTLQFFVPISPISVNSGDTVSIRFLFSGAQSFSLFLDPQSVAVGLQGFLDIADIFSPPVCVFKTPSLSLIGSGGQTLASVSEQTQGSCGIGAGITYIQAADLQIFGGEIVFANVIAQQGTNLPAAYDRARFLLTNAFTNLRPGGVGPIATVPEPGTLALLGLGLAGLGLARRKRAA